MSHRIESYRISRLYVFRKIFTFLKNVHTQIISVVYITYSVRLDGAILKKYVKVPSNHRVKQESYWSVSKQNEIRIPARIGIHQNFARRSSWQLQVLP